MTCLNRLAATTFFVGVVVATGNAIANESLPLPGVKIPASPALPASIVFDDGQKLLLDRLDVTLSYDPKANQLSCAGLENAWLINFPLSRIERPAGLSNDQLALRLTGTHISQTKNWYLRIGGDPQNDRSADSELEVSEIAIPSFEKTPTMVVQPETSESDNPWPDAIVFNTIQAAVDAARAGDTIAVLPGIYRESVTISHGGNDGNPIIIQGVATSDTRMPVISGNDVAPRNAFVPVAGHEGLFRAENWVDRPGQLTIDGRVAVERATAESLSAGEFCLNRGPRELAFPSLSSEFASGAFLPQPGDSDAGNNWQEVTANDEGFIDLSGSLGPTYLTSWLWLPPEKKGEVWDPRFPEPLTGDADLAGPFRAGRQTGTGSRGQLNLYRLWINGNLMPASGVPNGPTPNMAYGRNGDSWQRLPFREGWNQIVLLADAKPRGKDKSQLRMKVPKGVQGAVSGTQPSDGPPASNDDSTETAIQRWLQLGPLREPSAIDAEDAVYLQLAGGDDPSNHVIGMGRRENALIVDASRVVVRNLEFAHGSQFQQRALVNVNAPATTIEYCRFREPEVRCLSVNLTKWDQSDPPAVIRGNVFQSPGSLGIGASGSSKGLVAENQTGDIPGRGRMLVEYNRIYDNNRFGFRRQWESGGMKFFRLTGCVIRHNVIERGDGPGLWLDWEHFNNRVEGNFIRDVPMCAIGIEASPGPNLIANNVAQDIRNGNAWFQYALLGWSSARLWAVHNTIESDHCLMFAEGNDDRNTVWGKLPDRGAAVGNNLLVGRPVSIHRGRLQFIEGNQFFGPFNDDRRRGGVHPYSKWSYDGLEDTVTQSGQLSPEPIPTFRDHKRGDLRLTEDAHSRIDGTGVVELPVMTDGRRYNVLNDVRHDYFGLLRFSDSSVIPGAYRSVASEAGSIIELEMTDGSMRRVSLGNP